MTYSKTDRNLIGKVFMYKTSREKMNGFCLVMIQPQRGSKSKGLVAEIFWTTSGSVYKESLDRYYNKVINNFPRLDFNPDYIIEEININVSEADKFEELYPEYFI